MEPESLPKNEHAWLIEPLREVDSFIPKRMFGCLACYLYGRLMLILADSAEPWNGLLIAMERHNHEALRQEYPQVISHPILGKWLYLSSAHEHFEKIAREVVALCNANDRRIGSVTAPKKKRRTLKGSTKRKKSSPSNRL